MNLKLFLEIAELTVERIEEAKECEIINSCLIIKKSECKQKFSRSKEFKMIYAPNLTNVTES